MVMFGWRSGRGAWWLSAMTGGNFVVFVSLFLCLCVGVLGRGVEYR